MSAGLVAVLVITAVLLCVALGLVWWVNRPVSTDRAYARQTLPLFGSDVIIDEMIIDDEEDEGDETPIRRDDNVATGRKADSPDSLTAPPGEPAGGGERRAHRFAPPPGLSPVTSLQAPRAPEPTVEPRTVEPRSRNEESRPANGWNPQSPSAAPPHAGATQHHSAKNGAAASEGMRTKQRSVRRTPSAIQTVPSMPAISDDHADEGIGSSNSVSAGPTFEGKSLTFSVPADGTLQFLPGRLEITAGKDRGREVRFVRVPGITTPRVTFGRVDGPMYRHVQLHDQTVSRKHAIIELSNGDWTLTNLSTTNPVVHNEQLLGAGETQTLSDGDRIEMGEVVFRYRVR